MDEALVVCFRGIIGFFTLLIFARALGKQQLGEISYFDYILGITIGSFAANLTIDLSSAAWPHWIGLFTWTVMGILMQFISLKSKKAADYINDHPIIVIHNGKVLAKNLKEVKFTFSELLEQLRIKDIFDINEVKFAIIEANGQVSILKQEDFKNIILSMNIPKNDCSINNGLIFSGIVINDNLSKVNIDEQWLLNNLKKQKVNNYSEVFYAFMDSNNKLKLSLYKDNIISNKNIFK
ncbi:DUF421 domain-containing protein [Clostridium sediminicola]|uniref:DUF421 domain-containing protein n=1 Tax=Clostridium sediminicola TaxID=3114879 RepID=UPI0031F27D57